MVPSESLAAVPLFASLNDDQLRELANWFEERSASEGVQLCCEGAHGYSFFVLTDGTANVTAKGEHLAALEPGDFFGEIALLGESNRTATVTASSPAKLLVLYGTEFRRLETEHPDIAARIREAMEERLAVA